ncbi:SpoIVB peptidase [Alicyclobacillus vulcanalis]|uniref:Stage IV sporulation protein B n=1 Tax=Alicyclobacillus vulcanalis TaxID=252246 RepID=A0A1N7KMV6_9BACL|nr:SpoIVB peptidase [Alicyclobacillus vulcanalis]SIS62826.1 stage IV sporulation protein B [Alicyclobacillus vulcanalis]
MAGWLRALKVAVLVAATALLWIPPVRHLVEMPTTVEMSTDDEIALQSFHPFSIHTWVQPVESPGAVTVTADAGEFAVRDRIFGFIPWRTRVHIEPSERVVVGGQALGIRLMSQGPMVIGYRPAAQGVSLAQAHHIEVGDVILSVDGVPVHTAKDLQAALRQKRAPFKLVVARGDKLREVQIRDAAGVPELGVYVRDKAVGVGTLTFYDPATGRFAALGHLVTDADTGQPIRGQGAVFPAAITGIQAGRIGQPGEKKGVFDGGQREVGEIDENTPYGVFGRMDAAFAQRTSPLAGPIPVALPGQVHTGPAVLYTVLHGQKVEAFQVVIEHTARQMSPSTKSMIIRVTDPHLLDEAGGIVQGMSGSPIVQDGRLVGAVTHVFVSDPVRGYGVYAYWMLHPNRHELTFDPADDERPQAA